VSLPCTPSKAHGLERVAIIDFDVHHGNGTEDCFAGDEQVLMCSIFQHPFYPYSGTDKPAANMCNVPLAAGCGGEEFRDAVLQVWTPRLKEFKPQMIFISAGFDGHYEDDMGGLQACSRKTLPGAPSSLKKLAAEMCDKRIVSMLEGGYVMSSLARSVGALVVVVSAMSGETNRLIALAKEISPQSRPRELDVMLHRRAGHHRPAGDGAQGHRREGEELHRRPGRMLTDSTFTKARILQIDDDNIRKRSGRRQCRGRRRLSRASMRTATSPRSAAAVRTPPAVALAAALKADECQIYTDVDGVYTTDPRVVPEARKLDTITFEEMLEMASLGSKVLQIRSVEFAGKYKVKLRVLSSFEDEGEGTLITVEEDKNMEQPIISGIAFNRDEAKLTVLGVPDRPGIAYQILGPIADANIDVDMIIQNVGHDGTTDFSFTVNRGEFAKAMASWKASRATSAPARSLATTRSARSPPSASACARTRAWPARCSAPWPRKASTSR
jgi:aspartate kinase